MELASKVVLTGRFTQAASKLITRHQKADKLVAVEICRGANGNMGKLTMIRELLGRPELVGGLGERLQYGSSEAQEMGEENAFLRVEKGRVEGYDESWEIPLNTDVIVIGRPPRDNEPGVETSDVRIRDDYVSRGHTKIYYSYDQGCFMVQERDTGTLNGTFINEEPIEPGMPYPLSRPKELGAGPMMLRSSRLSTKSEGMVEGVFPQPTSG